MSNVSRMQQLLSPLSDEEIGRRVRERLLVSLLPGNGYHELVAGSLLETGFASHERATGNGADARAGKG